MKLRSANDTGCYVTIIKADSQHQIKFQQIAIEALERELHRHREVQKCIKMFVSVAAISRIQARRTHISRPDRLDLFNAFKFVAQQKLIKICELSLSRELFSIKNLLMHRAHLQSIHLELVNIPFRPGMIHRTFR